MVRKAVRRPLAEGLRAVRVALDGGDHEGALGALLAAWREARSTRVADLVDRVSRRIVRPPITGGLLDERVRRWRDIAEAKDPADVDRLVAAQWPGLWREGQKRMRRLFAFPDDPRIAMAIAHELTNRRYRDAFRFYGPLYGKLAQLGDVRVVPLLEARLEQLPPLERGVYPEAALVAKLAALAVPALAPDAVAELAALEAWFAGEIASERAKAKGEAEFLAAIYADLDDDAVRQVFADWLLDRGDPRGELIALQLAGVQLPRQTILLNRHGRAWAGALDDALEPDRRIWERGFLVGGVLRHQPLDLASPAWAMVHTLELRRGSDQRAVVAELAVLRLRGLRGLDEAVAVRLLAGPPQPHLRELGVVIEDDENHVTADLRAAAVPALAHLILTTHRTPTDLNRWPHSPVAAQVGKVTVRCGRDNRLGDWFHHYANYFARAEELALEYQDAWRLVATRIGAGPFRRVRVEPLPNAKLPSLLWVLRSLPRSLEELVIAGVDHDDELAAMLATFPNAVRTGA